MDEKEIKEIKDKLLELENALKLKDEQIVNLEKQNTEQTTIYNNLLKKQTDFYDKFTTFENKESEVKTINPEAREKELDEIIKKGTNYE